MRSRNVLMFSFLTFKSLRETARYFPQRRKARKGITGIALGLLIGCSITAFAQSSDQNFPTHVVSNEISGVIRPRNVGDGRLTTYFYLFEGGQGDIFINAETKNFSGDIDVYASDSLKPLTKMVMYADAGQSETGRLIYLRQPARLLLRIEGRTPNDDAATFRIKFAGSFVALAPETYEPPPMVVRKQSARSSQRSEVKTEEPTSKAEDSKSEDQRPKTEDQISEDPKPKAEDTIFENKSAKVTVKPAAKPTTTRRRTTTARTAKPKPQKPKTEDQKPKSDPLANVKLVVVFKDGTVMERPVTEIVRFSFDNGRLTIIEKNGTITRYQMATIAKVTIE